MTSQNKNEYYKVYDFNEEMIDYLVRLLRIMENENKNLILIGNDYCGKEILLKITLFIRKIDICEIDLYQLNSSYTDFEKRTLCPMIRDAVYNNKKKFILFTYKIFNTDDNIDYILETVSNMLNSSIVIERYKDFLDDKYTLDNNGGTFDLRTGKSIAGDKKAMNIYSVEFKSHDWNKRISQVDKQEVLNTIDSLLRSELAKDADGLGTWSSAKNERPQSSVGLNKFFKEREEAERRLNASSTP